MGMFSSPKFAKRTQQEAGLYQEVQAMQGEATEYGSAVRARLGDVANLADEKIRTAAPEGVFIGGPFAEPS